jgi:hypothetical protein
MNLNHVIYVIKRPDVTGDLRKYIGVSSYSEKHNPNKRWQTHKAGNTRVGRFIRKYSDVYMELIHENLTKEQAYILELELVPKDPAKRKSLMLLNNKGGGIMPPSYQELDEQTVSKKLEKLKLALKKHYSCVENREKRRKEMLIYHSNRPELKDIISKRQREYMLSKKRNYVLLSPKNEIFTQDDMCLSDLADKYNVALTNLCKVISGKIKSIKGWRLPENISYTCPKLKSIKLINKEGQVYEIHKLFSFCKEQSLDYSYIRKMIKASEGNQKYFKYKSHKGWVVCINQSNCQTK